MAFLMSFWRESLILLITASLGLQTMRLDSAQMHLELIKHRSTIAKGQSDANLTRLQEAVPIMVDQASQNAWRNAKARYGTCNAAGGIRDDGLLPTLGGGQAPSPASPEPARREQLVVDAGFVEACARDATRLNLWIDACKSNPMICEFKE